MPATKQNKIKFKMKITICIVEIFLFFGATITLSGQDFISVDELANGKKKNSYTIIDARGKREYGTSHIKGALSVPVDDLSDSLPYKGALKTPEQITSILCKHGVNEKMDLVVYCNRGNAAGRMYWILKYLGTENVYMLDGNIGAWERAGEPMSGKSTKRKHKKSYAVELNSEIIASLEDVESATESGSALLVDIRPESFFDGSDAKSKGHIKGAVSLPSENLQEKSGLIKTGGELLAMMESIGISSEMELILYGQNAKSTGIVFNVLTTMLEFSNVKVYDGSYNEWAMEHQEELVN